MTVAYVALLESSAIVTTVLQFLSGVIICKKYVQKKSTNDSSGFPFLCGFLSCSFWLSYGILSDIRSVIVVNTIGVTLFFIYALTYYIFTVTKKAYLKQFALIAALFLAVIYYINNLGDPQHAIHILGVVCCIVTVCYFAAPLTMLVHVMRIKSSDSLPFPLIVMSLLVSIQWLIFGIIIADSYIQIPNFLGCVLSLLQLSLFVCYPPKTFSGPEYKLVDQSTIY